MAVLDDINSFVNKAKQRIVLLGDELLSAQQSGKREDIVRYYVTLINKLNSAIIGLTSTNSFTNGEIYSIISYYNELGNLTPLGIAYINPTEDNIIIQQKIIFVSGSGTYLLASNNLSDVVSGSASRINLGINTSIQEYANFAAYKADTLLATTGMVHGLVDSDVNNNGNASYYVYSKILNKIFNIPMRSTVL